MNKLVLYRVKFYIKKFGEHHYFYYCYAHNAKEARSFAENAWYSYNTSHMFRIAVSRDNVRLLVYNLCTFYRFFEF